MRVAVVGLPGTGKTTLAAVLARELAAPTVTSITEVPGLLQTGTGFVLDGLPCSLAQLGQIEALGAGSPVLDRVIWLQAASDVRAKRIGLSHAENTDSTEEDDDRSVEVELAELGAHLHGRDILIPIFADGSPYKVMALAFEALDIRI